MYVDVPDFDCLLIAPPMAVEGLDHLVLQPKKFDRITSIYVDVLLGHVSIALSKKSQIGESRCDDLYCQKGLQLRLRMHGIYVKREPPPDAKDWEGKPDKVNLLSPNPGTGD
jgi:hypothetical protein